MNKSSKQKIMSKPVQALSSSGTKLREKGIKQRQEILDIARETILIHGLDGIVLRQIAEEASIKLGHLQHYFATKDDLIEAVVWQVARNEEAVLRAAASESKDIEFIFKALIDQWEQDNVRIYTSILEGTGQRSRFVKIKQSVCEEIYEALVSVFKTIHPDKSHNELLLMAMRVSALLDGAALQAYSGSASTIKRRKKQLRDAVLSDLVRIVNG